jgi:hypothetical protein
LKQRKNQRKSVLSVAINGEVFSAGFRREADLRAERRATGAELAMLQNYALAVWSAATDIRDFCSSDGA